MTQSLHLRYVPHEQVDAFEQAGWVWIRFSLGHHGCHSALMAWPREEEPREPARSESEEAA